MNLRTNVAAACGLAALLALSAPASAASFTYDLAGDTSTAYTDPNPIWVNHSYIDLHDATSGSTDFPGYTLHAGDTLQVTVALNHPVTFNSLDIFLQETNDETTWIGLNETYSFFQGATAVPGPTPDGTNIEAARGGLGFYNGFYGGDTGMVTFDKVIVNAVVTALTDASGGTVGSIDLTKYVPYIDLYNPGVASTPVPGSLVLALTAFGGLSMVGWRKRTFGRKARAAA
jgi:hypothetical protein